MPQRGNGITGLKRILKSSHSAASFRSSKNINYVVLSNFFSRVRRLGYKCSRSKVTSNSKSDCKSR